MMKPPDFGRKRSLVIHLAAIALGCLVVATAWGEDRLIDEEPYDLLTVPDGTATKTYKISPVKLPNRRVPENIRPSDKLRVRLLEDDESRDFEVIWKDVKLLELFENRIRDEADKLASEQKFDAAYDNLAFLLKNYPNTESLDRSLESFWYLSAAAAYRAKRYDEALAVLEVLLGANPAYKHSETSPSLMKVLGDITDKLAQRYLDAKDYGSARLFISRIASTYPESKQEPFYARFQERLSGEASAKRDAASAFLAAKQYTEAYDAAAAMMSIWPDVEGARELSTQISTAYPLVVIGVNQLSTKPNATELTQWANRRTGRLADRRLMELKGIGPEGGSYFFSLGSAQRAEDGSSLLLTVQPPGNLPVTSYEVARRLMAAGSNPSSSFAALWQDALAGVRLVKNNQVEAMLRSPPPLVPEALLQFPLASAENENEAARAGSYVLMAPEPKVARFVLPPERTLSPGQPREVQERLFNEPEAEILALERGTIDVIDRVLPADLPLVQKVAGIAVAPYAVPTLHVLAPNTKRIWPANRTFRRALMYAINREIILREGILRGRTLPGAQLLSGPVPAPLDANDPLSYAYDSSVESHAYEPLLAATLITLSKREIESTAKAKGEEPPKLTKITLGYPAMESARITCKAIAKQLEPIGLVCEAIELAADGANAQDCDFIFSELFITEPLVDMPRLFGPQGLYPAASSHVRLAVKQAEQSATWRQASSRMRQLHRLLHEELTVLPLWQIPEFYAYRKSFAGIQSGSISLYQDIENWRVSPRFAP